MKIFEHLTQLDNAVGFYRKGIIAILIVCAILMTAMYIHTETRILQATSSAYILNQDGDVAIATRIRAARVLQDRGRSTCTALHHAVLRHRQIHL